MLLITLILQHEGAFEWLVCLVMFAVVVINLIHPCLFGANPINGEALLVLSAQTDRTIKDELDRAQAKSDN